MNTRIMGNNCCIHNSVKIGNFVVVEDNLTQAADVVVGNHVVIHKDTIVGAGVTIHDGAVLGKQPMRAARSIMTTMQELPPLKWRKRIDISNI